MAVAADCRSVDIIRASVRAGAYAGGMPVFDTPADRKARPFLWLTVVVLEAGLLLGLFVHLSQLEGKGWLVRTIFYTLILFVLPVSWRLSRRRFAFSYLATGLLAAPFAIDIWGNIFGLYDSIDGFDNYLHFINWTLLVGSFTVSVLRSSSLSRKSVVAIAGGFGSTMIILWETMEYLVMKAGTESLHLTYEDTIGDLLLSMSGGYVSALFVTLLLTRRAVRKDLALPCEADVMHT